jgi:thiol-disulfide isomerase/thioredoxin
VKSHVNKMLRSFGAHFLLFLSVLLYTHTLSAAEEGRRFVDINGATVDLQTYRGKWVVVNYWATWCPPCQEEIPELILFHESHKDSDAVVIGISMDETPVAALSRFVEENMMTYPIVPMRSDMPMIGNIPGLPTTYLIDPTGKTVAMKVGQVTIDMLESFIKKSSK